MIALRHLWDVPHPFPSQNNAFLRFLPRANKRAERGVRKKAVVLNPVCGGTPRYCRRHCSHCCSWLRL